MSAPAPCKVTAVPTNVGQPTNVLISWTGGAPPYQLWKTDALNANPVWYTNGMGGPTMKTQRVLPTSGSQGYFRVQWGIPLLTVHLDSSALALPDQQPAQANPTPVLSWSVPELA